MVIPDWSGRSQAQVSSFAQDQERLLALARPVDRMAAAIIDVFVLLGPIYFLLSAPLKRWMATSFIVGSEADFAFSVVLLALLGVAIAVVYQTAAVFLFTTTVGMRLFDLRVVSLWKVEPPSLGDALFRSLFWVLEACCLGLPWLSVFSDPYRRALHDRATDTVVITTVMKARVEPPLAWERGLVRSFFAFCLSFVFLIGVIQIRGIWEKVKVESALWSASGAEGGECEAVSRHLSSDREDEHGRLSMAMSLYAAGLADRSCLEAEVEREIALQIPISGITYLAQAFVYADEAEISNAYLDKVCADSPESTECLMSQLVSSWSDEDWETVEDILSRTPSGQGSGYLEVWGVRHYMKQAQYTAALGLLDVLSTRRDLSEFSLVQRVKALFNTYKESEAKVALQQAMVALPEQDAHELGMWMCVQQLQNSCEALKSPACWPLPKWDGYLNLSQSSESLARVMARECEVPMAMDYVALGDMARGTAWKSFFRANLKLQKGDRSAAADNYMRVIDNEDSPELLRLEATRRLAEFANKKQIENLTKSWGAFESRETWVKAGNILLSRLVERKNSELALPLARHLIRQEALSPKSKDLLQAMALAAKPEPERIPASEKPRESVRSLLESLGEDP